MADFLDSSVNALSCDFIQVIYLIQYSSYSAQEIMQRS